MRAARGIGGIGASNATMNAPRCDAVVDVDRRRCRRLDSPYPPAIVMATGNADLATLLEHDRVAAREAVEGEREPAEPVVLVRVGAGEIDDEIGAPTARTRGRARGEQREVLVVAGPSAKLDVETARPLCETGSSGRRAC